MSTGCEPPVIGVIGGSGVYEIDGLENATWMKISTPFGDPSDELLFGTLNGQRMVFLPRHGRGHKISPTDLNFRANICALKIAGVTEIISVSACGSLKEELAPGTFVLVDQFIDRSFARVKTFFRSGLVAHVAMADPVCERLAGHLATAAAEIGVPYHKGGTYLVMEGPQFSTKAESNLYRSWGMDVIGMTNLTEARLAREAELCYVTVAMVTDYDCWHPEHDHVTVEQIIGVLMKNAENACNVVREAVAVLPKERGCKCGSALKHAIITQKDAVPPEALERLKLLVGKYFDSEKKAGA